MTSFQQVKEYITGVLRTWFPNKRILDKFSESNGVVMYNGNAIGAASYAYGQNDTPVGTIIAFMGTTPPEHYLECDGRTLNITDYPELAQFFKEQLGNIHYFGGDGITTFDVPDLNGEFLRGAGGNHHTNSVIGLLEGGGANVGVHQEATPISAVYGDSNGNMAFSRNSYPVEYDNDSTLREASGHFTYKTDSNYYNLVKYFTTRPTNTSVLWCIKYETVYPEQYSLEEKRIGTWYDGKAIYRKVLELTLPSGKQNYNRWYEITSLNINALVRLEGIVMTTVNQYPILPYGGLWIDGLPNSAHQYLCADLTLCPAANYFGQKITVILEYTKNS